MEMITYRKQNYVQRQIVRGCNAVLKIHQSLRGLCPLVAVVDAVRKTLHEVRGWPTVRIEF